jgi:hypothetical protein
MKNYFSSQQRWLFAAIVWQLDPTDCRCCWRVVLIIIIIIACLIIKVSSNSDRKAWKYLLLLTFEYHGTIPYWRNRKNNNMEECEKDIKKLKNNHVVFFCWMFQDQIIVSIFLPVWTIKKSSCRRQYTNRTAEGMMKIFNIDDNQNIIIILLLLFLLTHGLVHHIQQGWLQLVLP